MNRVWSFIVKLPPVSTEKILSLISVLAQYVGLFALFKLLATYLDGVVFAEYLLFIAAVNFLLGLPFTGIQQAIIRFVPGMDAFQSRNVLRVAVVQSIIVAILIILLLSVISFIPFTDKFARKYHIGIAFIFCLTEAFKLYILAYENALLRRGAYLKIIISEHSLKIITASILLVFDMANFINLVFSLALSNIVVILISSYREKFRIKIRKFVPLVRSKISWQIFNFSLPVACWSIFGWMRDMSGRYIVDTLMAKEDVAGFAVLTTLTSLIPGLINSFIGNYHIPIVYADYNSGKVDIEKNINKIATRLFFLGFVIVIILIYTSNFFILIAASEKYYYVAKFLPYTLSAYFIFSIAMLASTELYAKNKNYTLIIPNLIAGLVGATSLYQLTFSYGFNGAVFGYIITYMSYAISVLILILYFRK